MMGLGDEVARLRERVEKLEEVVVSLESRVNKSPGGPPRKTPVGMCYITGLMNYGGPDDCPHRSTYRYQKQCRGGPCVEYGREYYREDYRENRATKK